MDEKGALSRAADLPDHLGTWGLVEWGYVSVGGHPNRLGFIFLPVVPVLEGPGPCSVISSCRGMAMTKAELLVIL